MNPNPHYAFRSWVDVAVPLGGRELLCGHGIYPQPYRTKLNQNKKEAGHCDPSNLHPWVVETRGFLWVQRQPDVNCEFSDRSIMHFTHLFWRQFILALILMEMFRVFVQGKANYEIPKHLIKSSQEAVSLLSFLITHE